MTYVICPGSGRLIGPRFVTRFPAEPADLRIAVCPRCWQNIPCSRRIGDKIGAYIMADHAVKETLTPKAGNP